VVWGAPVLVAGLLVASRLSAGAAGERNPTDEPQPRKLNEYAAQAWKRSRGLMTDILDLKEQKRSLPRRALMQRDQKDAEDDIQELLEDVLEVLQHSSLTDYRAEYAKMEREIAERRDELRDLREARVTAEDEKAVWEVFELTKADYTKRIEKQEEEITARKKKQDALVEKLREEYKRQGITLSTEQVRFYLASISGRDIMALSAIFDNVRALNWQLEDLMRNNPGDPEAARRYYGIHVVLLRTVMLAHEVTLSNIADRYLPRIGELEQRNAAARAETARLLEKAPPSQRAVLTATSRAQGTTDRALQLYRTHLMSVRKRVETGLAALQKRYSVANNAYDTITISSALAAEMKTAIKDLTTLSSMYLPELVPFDSAAIAQKFNEITAKLENQ